MANRGACILEVQIREVLACTSYFAYAPTLAMKDFVLIVIVFTG